MKKLAALIIVLIVTLGQAQAPLRVLVLPFDATQSFQPYGLALATGLQRTLNSLDGIYVPPVAEAGLFVTRAHEAGLAAVATATEAFEAEAVISGAVTGDGATVSAVLMFDGPLFDEPEQIRLELPNQPAGAVEGLVAAVLPRLQVTSQAASERAAALAAETPEVASLSAVARASSRLGANLGELTAAAELNPESSWTLAERARALALAGRSDEAVDVAARAVEANGQDAEALVVQGIVANAAGNAELARESFQSALELNPAHALALTGMASLTDDQAQARALLERAVEASPRLTEAVLQLAGMQESPQERLRLLRRASDNLPESVALHRAFIDTAVAAGDAAGALAYLRDVTSDDLAASPALYAQAARLPDELAEEALALVREGRERFPDSSGLELSEAELLRETGQQQEAIAILEDLHERFPESVEVANSLAVTLARRGEVERAREVFSSVAEESPTVTINLGRLLLEAGQARAAVETLEPLVESDMEDADLHTLYGLALGRTGRTAEALDAISRALEIDPESEDAQRAQSLLQQRSQLLGDDAIALEGEAAAAFEEGLYLLETNQPAAAAAEFAAAFEASQHPLTAFYRGYALQLAGEPRRALSAYEAAREGFPESDVVLNNLGYTQLQLGRLDLAMESLNAAYEANDQNPDVLTNLGLLHYGLGRYDEALEWWDRAIALDPALEQELAEIRARAQERRDQ